MDKPTASSATGAKQQIEKQARQLAYDTRYKVKQAMSAKSGARLDPAAVRKAYMSQLGKSSAAPAVKARAKQMLLGEDLIDARELANNSIVSALYTVFVEGVEEEVVVEENEYVQQLNEMEEKKYKIKVTDKKTGNTYVRMATREKIRELRANPNISSVEMTEYGTISKSESESGSQTAAVKAGKDYDGDGKVESGAKEYRGAVHNAIQRKKGLKPDGKDTSSVKEEVIYEKENAGEKKITGKGVDNYKTKSVKISPDMSEQMKPTESEKPKAGPIQDRSAIQQVLLAKQKVDSAQKDLANKQRMAAQKKVDLQSLSASYEPEGDSLDEKITAKTDMGTAIKDFYASKSPQLAGRTKEERRKAAIAAVLTARRGGRKLGEECECEDEKEPKLKKDENGAEDPRSIPTKMNLVKNKLRAMGLKMDYEPEGEVIDERRKEDKVAGTPRKPRNPAFELVAKSMGAGRLGVQPRGKKKVPGQKPPVAGQYGAPKSPAQKLAMRRAATQRAKELEQDTRGT